MTTGLVWDERYAWYDFGDHRRMFPGFPLIQPGTPVESPESKRRIVNLIAATGLREVLVPIEARQAPLEDLLLVHDRDYLERIRAVSAGQGGFAGHGAPVPVGGFEIAALAVGGVTAAIDAVLAGAVRNAYALVRPPGHHAERETGVALCVLANVAIAVKSAMRRHGLDRVAIIDWDAHHGNGTESAFYADASVLTLSIHQDQMIPGRGLVEHRGEGVGHGYNINIPLPPGSGAGAWLAACERVVLPAVRRFAPDLIVVASGLDAGITDPTARMLLTPGSYRQLAKQVVALADEVSRGRLVMSHEGGYDPTLAPFCALAVLEEMAGRSPGIPVEDNPYESASFGLLGGSYQELQSWQEPFIARAEALVADVAAA